MVLYCIVLYNSEETEIMQLVQQRLETVELMPADSEDEMVNQLLAWRSASDSNSTNGNRVDSCINGYGMTTAVAK